MGHWVLGVESPSLAYEWGYNYKARIRGLELIINFLFLQYGICVTENLINEYARLF